MSDYIEFIATSPDVQPATEEKTYDRYWLANMRIMAGDSTKPVTLVANFVPSRHVTIQVPSKDGEGVVIVDGNGDPVLEDFTYSETKPNAQPKRLIIKDLFAEANANPEGIGAVLNGVLGVLKDKAIEEDLF